MIRLCVLDNVLRDGGVGMDHALSATFEDS